MIRTELGGHPVIRDLKMAPDKVIGQALRSMSQWESLGKCRRLGRQARWHVREGFDRGTDTPEFVPLSAIRGQGASPEAEEDDLLG